MPLSLLFFLSSRAKRGISISLTTLALIPPTLAGSDSGKTVVFEPGRAYKEVARNTLEKYRCSPVFEGKRMYIRAFDHLYCMGD